MSYLRPELNPCPLNGGKSNFIKVLLNDQEGHAVCFFNTF